MHSGSYGNDQGRQGALIPLLEGLENIPDLERIRLNSIEPGYVSDALIDYVANSRKLCRHFHLPLQSGDDDILKRMGRHYTRADYAGRVEKIASLIPDCALGADVMVGFPGEQEAHFANTRALIADLPLTYLHVFPFSLRAGTPAAHLKGHQKSQVKSDRTRRLIQLGEDKRLGFHRRFVGRRLEVLVEDRRDKATGLAVGLTDNYIKVLFDETENRANQFVQVHLTQAREDLVFGESET